MEQLHQDEKFTCPIMDADDNFHFELRCEDCDIRRLAKMSLGDVVDRWAVGRVTLNQYDAYRWMWAFLSPYDTYAHWCSQTYVVDPDVQRIARKLLRARKIEISAWPAVLAEGITDEDQA